MTNHGLDPLEYESRRRGPVRVSPPDVEARGFRPGAGCYLLAGTGAFVGTFVLAALLLNNRWLDGWPVEAALLSFELAVVAAVGLIVVGVTKLDLRSDRRRARHRRRNADR